MTNAQILSAVILKWGEPILPAVINTAISGYSAKLLPVEKFLKNWGLAPEQWSIGAELNNLIGIGGTNVFRPYVDSFFSRLPDSAIPAIAHNYVDQAIKTGSLPLFGGRITFDKEDLVELKKYLECNLPYNSQEEYVVKLPPINKKPENPKPDGEESSGQ